MHHSWDLAPKDAIALQSRLAPHVRRRTRLREGRLRTIAGADCAFDHRGRFGYAGVVVYSYPDLAEIQRVGAKHEVSFPYVPGLLSFRETPLLLEAFKK